MRYVFGTPGKSPFNPGEAALSADLVHYWLAFAKSGGDPNGPGTPLRWPRYDAAGATGAAEIEATLEFNSTRRLLTGGFKTELCRFWDKYSLASETGAGNRGWG